MKNRIRKVACLLLSMLMILSSLPLGVLAEEQSATPSVPTVNNESSTNSFPVPEVDAAANPEVDEVVVPVPEITPPEASQTIATSETIETMATDDKYEFTIDASNRAYITKYTDINVTELTIPETLTATGKVVAVAGIKKEAFLLCTSLTKVTISPNITSMEGKIFTGSVTIYGVEGSLANNYAVEWGLAFQKAAVFYVADFKASQASGVTIKTPITLTATVSTWSKSIALVKFYYDLTDYSNSHSSTDIASGTATSAIFTPTKAGTYTLYVEVTDTDGNKCIKTINNFEVVPAITLEATETSPQYVGQALNLTANVDDGIATTAYDYQFSYQLGTKTAEIQASSATKTCSYQPPLDSSGAYTFKVTVKNQSGTKAFTGTKTLEFNVIDYVYVKTFTVDKLSPQEVGTALTLKAEAAGGKTVGYKYRFFYKLSGGSEEFDIQDYSDKATVVFRPTDPGIYQLGVQVMNAMGVPSEAKTLAAMTIVSTPDGSFTAAKADGSPFYVDDTDEIILTVNNPTGFGTLYYEYFYSLGTSTEKKLIGTETTDSSKVFKPTEKGTYTFYVKVTDKDPTNTVATTKTVSNYVVYDKLDGTLKANLSSPQNKGTTIILTASATGGKAPYTYAFSNTPPGGSASVGAATPSNKTNLTLDKDGVYSIAVEITDANGIEVTQTIPAYTVNNNPQITKFEPQAKIAYYINEGIDFTAEIEGGTAPYTYAFSGKLGSQPVWNPAIFEKTNVTDKAKIRFTPVVAGTYSFEVKVTDATGLTETKTIKDYKVLPAVAAKTLKTDKPTGQNIGTPIKLTATGSGGKAPYTYKFYYDRESATTPLTGGNYTNSSTVVFNPTISGTYTLYVDVKDANGKETVKAGVISNYKVVNTPVLASFSANKDMTVGKTGTVFIYPGDTVNLKAKTTDGTGEGTTLSYQFFYKQGSTEIPIGSKIDKTTPNKYDEAASSFDPGKAGTYVIYVRVTDANGSKDEKKIASLTVLGTVAAKAVKVSKTKGVIVSDTVKLTATPTGGKAPYTYKFYYQKGIGPLTLITSDPAAKTVNYTFANGSGDYTFYVQITDDNKVDNGNTTELTELKKSASPKVTVTNPPNLSSLSYEKISGKTSIADFYVGDTLKLKAKAQEGSGEGTLTYHFFYKQGSTEVPIGAPQIKTGETGKKDEATVDFDLTKAGTYAVSVRITDGTSEKVSKIGSLKVLDTVTVKAIKESLASGQNINTTIKLTATGVGGKTPYTYQFYTIHESSTTENPINNTYTSSKTADFKPTKAGTYTLHVRIKDANGDLCTNDKDMCILDYEVIDNPVITDFSATEKSGTYVNVPINLTATVNGGAGPYTYRFTSKWGLKTENLIANNTDGKVAFTPSEAGTYKFYVYVTDSEGNPKPEAKAEIKSFVVYDIPTVEKFTASSTSIDKGKKVTLKAVVAGGQSPYKYKFYYMNGTTSTPIRDLSTTSSYTWTPPDSGTYTVYVDIVDKQETTVTSDAITITVK